VRKQRTGTFVAENTRQIKAVGIYFGGSFWRIKHAAFYQTLYAALCEHFEGLGITVHLFMDSRPRMQQGTPWKPLISAIERSEVSAVIASMTTSEEVAWLEQLSVPLSLLGAGRARCAVDFGMDDFLHSSLVRLKERKCRSVALISGSGLAGFDSFLEQAEEIGLKSRPEWVLQRNSWPEEFEEFGFESFENIWSGATKPDGLIVFPDNIALGVIMAILQKGVRVPEELKLVLHCNEEVYIHCPLPADWQVVSIAKIVKALWKSLRAQADGKSPRKISTGLTLQPVSPDQPPMFRKWRSGESQFVQHGSKLS
jgi:DNA-binding LacI/PurR family transcriptional regulator